MEDGDLGYSRRWFSQAPAGHGGFISAIQDPCITFMNVARHANGS